jgi:predicted methyltransferase
MRHSALAILTAVALAALTAAANADTDIYGAAVGHPGRSADDLKRDAIDHPAEVLRLAGIKPGMQVADYLAADGYYSELLSYIVGPTCHVLLLNDGAYDYWSNNDWEKRLQSARLPNVEHRTIDPQHLALPDRSLDAALLIKVYHDFYWVDERPGSPWRRLNPGMVLDEIARTLKPGGILLLVDHSARPGTGSADASSIHRIDEAYARADFERHGFEFVAASDVLRRPDDPRDRITWKGPMVGKTDRFVIVFRKRR